MNKSYKYFKWDIARACNITPNYYSYTMKITKQNIFASYGNNHKHDTFDH